MHLPAKNPPRHKLFVYTALALVLLVIVLRFVNLDGDFPPGIDWSSDQYTDEGWYSGNAAAWAITGQWYIAGDFNSIITLPVFQLIQMAFFRLLGISLLSARLSVALFSVIMIGLVYLLARRLSSSTTAGLASLLLAVNFTVFAYSRVAFLEIPLTTFVLLSLLLAISFPRAPVLALWLAALSFTAAILIKTTALPFLPALLFAAWMRPTQGPPWTTRRRILFCSGLFVAVAVLLLSYEAYAYTHFPDDYRYLNTANVVLRWEWTPYFLIKTALRVLYHGIVLDRLLYPLALGLAGVLFLGWREFRWHPLVLLSLALFIPYGAFLAIRGYLPPRYYIPLSVPLVFLASVSGLQVYRKLQPTHWKFVLGGVAGIIVILNLVSILRYMSTPKFTVRDMEYLIRRKVMPAGEQPPYLLGNLSNSISLGAGIPSINTELGVRDLDWRLAKYHPEYYVSLGEDRHMLGHLDKHYLLEPIASYHALGDYYHGHQVYLYRLEPH